MSKFLFIFVLIALLPCIYSAALKPKPKSCVEVKELRCVRVNGYYSIHDSSNRPFLVYCDFESDLGFGWTLVEAFTFSRRRLSSHYAPYYYNRPVSESSPNWLSYRLSKARMISIYHAKSTSHIRATCNFNSISGRGLSDMRDYMRVPKCQFPHFFVCRRIYYCTTVDYINVRGYSCRHCRVPFYAYGSAHLHVTLNYKAARCMDFKVPDAKANEHVFGYYANYNTQFRCSNSSGSTTNWWLGGNILR